MPEKETPLLDLDRVTDGNQRLGSVAVISTVDCSDPDAITVDVSHRHSYRSSDPPKDHTDEMNEGDVSEQFGTSVAQAQAERLEVNSVEPPTGADSPGYARVQMLASNISLSEKIVIFSLIMVLATALSLDNFLRGLYEVRHPSLANSQYEIDSTDHCLGRFSSYRWK